MRKVASDHGGTVELRSELGVGTRLRLVLPVEDVDSSRIEGKASSFAAAGSSATAQPDLQTANANAPTSENLIRPALADAPRRSVLLAEGDQALGRTFAHARSGARVTTWCGRRTLRTRSSRCATSMQRSTWSCSTSTTPASPPPKPICDAERRADYRPVLSARSARRRHDRQLRTGSHAAQAARPRGARARRIARCAASRTHLELAARAI